MGIESAIAAIGAASTTTKVGLGLAAVSGAAQIASMAQQKKAQRAQQQQQELVSRRERRQAIRQAQRLRAQSVATAVGTGATGSSSLSGGLSSLGSQVGEGLGFSTQGSALSRDISRASTKAEMLDNFARLGTRIGGSMIKAGGGLDFSGKPLEQPAPRSGLMNLGGSGLYGASSY